MYQRFVMCFCRHPVKAESIFSTPQFRTASTTRKNTMASTTMMKTMMVVSIVSFQRRPGDLGGFLAHFLKELERVRLGHLVIRFLPSSDVSMAGAEGLEPPACGFGDRRSTN